MVDLRAFDSWFSGNEWPSAPCPECKLGDLHIRKGSIVTVTTADSDRHRNDSDWEPEWLFGYFHGVIYCTRPVCDEKVVVSGDWRTEWSNTTGNYEDRLRLRYAMPALPLAVPPVKAPSIVVERLKAVSQVVWTDPASAANGLRRCVEALLDHQKVNKTQLTKKGKRRTLSTHERIAALKAKQPVAATSLEAVKWVGNQGSHASFQLTATDCVESALYLDHALRVLYDTSDAEIIKKAKAVNRAKGIKRRRDRNSTVTVPDRRSACELD